MKFDRKLYLRWHKIFSENRAALFAADLAAMYSVFVFGAMALYVFERNRQMFLPVLAAFFVGWFAVSGLVVYFYKKLRPYQQFNFTPPGSHLFSRPDRIPDSFPSQHVIAMAAVAVAFWPVSPLLSGLAFLLAILTGIARTLLGYHYPSDIAGALVLGAASGTLALLAFTKL